MFAVISKRPRLLDLFCGAGGCSVGYHRAGFDVVGVDVKDQKRYPFEFVRSDALEYVREHGHEYDAIHASPPCQRYSVANRGLKTADKFPDLVGETRERLHATGKLFAIENVVGAPLMCPTVLCGTMFGLGTAAGWLRRHRLFETSFLILAPPCRHPRGMSIGVYGNGTNSWHREKLGRNITIAEQREAMGIDWMTRAELTQAIPPAYTEYIGERFIDALL